MSQHIILASGSEIRATLLRNAGIAFDVEVAKVDEEMLRMALEAEQAPPRDIADALAEAKAAKVARKNPDALVIGCDQVLDFEGQVFSKPKNVEDARDQLKALRGKRHTLLSAVVIFHEGEPVWRHIGMVRLQMRDFSDAYLEEYLERNWESIRWSVGGYKLEEEGVRLFHRVDGDYFNVLGMPLIEVLNYLMVRGDLMS
ncbi:Maf family nucleotide pyrophosphatase [Shimia sp. CNT1-13L.2]|uniref:Maf family protein n=1 Tax=Shimia sp. CNT1-13L.2 TaxID=2959663 RepID=UPI0020CC3DF0|nr:Maf family nucleotide pyrophosphatase [Shimia sp. CNT1-13L.2]MCP9482618.1 Maf family nucleotide pyrophosphatase [Shimia sp. CNT1-13L.2]